MQRQIGASIGTEHVLRLEGVDTPSIAQLWVIGRLQWANLNSTGEYKTWDIKLAMTNQDTALLADFLSTCGILGQTWSKSNLTGVLSLSARQTAVASQLKLMEEDEERTCLEAMLETNLYPLA